MVATVAVVARNGETYTCTVWQIVVVVRWLREERQVHGSLPWLQSVNQDSVYTGKYCFQGSRQIFERTNCPPIQPVYAEPCKFCYSTASRDYESLDCLYKSIQIFASLSFGMAF